MQFYAEMGFVGFYDAKSGDFDNIHIGQFVSN